LAPNLNRHDYVTSGDNDCKQVIIGLYDAIAAVNLTGFLGALHPEFQAEPPGYLPWGGTLNGPGEFKSKALAGMASMINVGSVKLRDLYGEGDRVFVTATARALRTSEEFMIGEDWTVKNGKVYRLRLLL
jgi:hypothetical protein